MCLSPGLLHVHRTLLRYYNSWVVYSINSESKSKIIFRQLQPVCLVLDNISNTSQNYGDLHPQHPPTGTFATKSVNLWSEEQISSFRLIQSMHPVLTWWSSWPGYFIIHEGQFPNRSDPLMLPLLALVSMRHMFCLPSHEEAKRKLNNILAVRFLPWVFSVFL